MKMQKIKKSKNKNVALCFSGQVKNLELCYPYIKKNLLDHIGSYDIFCCPEDDSNLNKIKMLKPIKTKKVKSSDVDKIIKDKLKFLNKINYKNIIYSESSSFNFRNIYQQFFKMKTSFELLEKYMEEENVSYNYFIRIRFDFLPLDIINLEDFKMKNNEIVLPDNSGHKLENEVIDMFYITKDFDTFKSCSSLYNSFVNIIQENNSIKPNFSQKFYFFFEKNYNSFFFFLLKKMSKKQRKLSKNLLGFMLQFTKMFYKDFKLKKGCSTEKILFSLLKSKKKIIREKKINFVIVRNLTDGRLLF